VNATASVRAKWVDFHCHLDLYPDHAELIEECDREGVATLTVTTTPKAWARNQEMAAHAKHVRVALGLHPQLVEERESEIALFESLLNETRYVGEIGLDASPRFYKSFAAQERVFERILRACGEHGGKILTVHSVRSVSKVLKHIEKSLLPGRGEVVLHWFTGSLSEARRAVDLGCYFSINSEMLKGPRHRALVEQLPIERILTETDGPFVQNNGAAVRPRAVADTVTDLASVKGLNPSVTAALILGNLSRLLKR
jgi:TatD DNase family protein